MKNGIAVIVGALVIFASGYMLGYTTALPDFLRAATVEGLDPGKIPTDAELEQIIQGEIEIGDLGIDGGTAQDSGMDEQMAATELEHLKRMIVPMLTDEEIKRIRAETAGHVPADGEQPVPPPPAP